MWSKRMDALSKPKFKFEYILGMAVLKFLKA